ncbi:MAG: GNAT family N-acetyltransferase [Eubacteriales bacterium]|nr:GNAT family N-acetyltransferase [Eubacteriales bacterium]
MVYYRDNELVIRNLEEMDAQVFTDEEIAQGWDTDISKYLTRLHDQSVGKCVSLTAVYKGLPAGYVNVYLAGRKGAFEGEGFPEIVDFSVLEKYRRKGIGSKLMDVAEEIAGQYANMVWLGVGLHSGYGSAQRMYIKRGYIPDGTGVWYQDKPCARYETEIVNDDDLILFLSKKIEQQGENELHK